MSSLKGHGVIYSQNPKRFTFFFSLLKLNSNYTQKIFITNVLVWDFVLSLILANDISYTLLKIVLNISFQRCTINNYCCHYHLYFIDRSMLRPKHIQMFLFISLARTLTCKSISYILRVVRFIFVSSTSKYNLIIIPSNEQESIKYGCTDVKYLRSLHFIGHLISLFFPIISSSEQEVGHPHVLSHFVSYRGALIVQWQLVVYHTENDSNGVFRVLPKNIFRSIGLIWVKFNLMNRIVHPGA